MIPKITVDTKGRVTNIENISVGSSVIGAPLDANKIIVGSNTNTAADVYMSGDVAIVSSGATTVNSVGGVSSSTITTVASSVNSATSVNTPNTIVKRDGSGGFSTGTITGTLSGTASNANALTTGRTIGITGDITYTSPTFNGTQDVTAAATLANSGVISNTYGTSTSVPTITIDSKGRITSATTTNIPSATSSVTGLLTSTDYQTFNAKQNALTLGTGIQTFLATPTSTNLSLAVTDEGGAGALVFSNNPILTNTTLTGTLTLTSPLSVANGGTGTSTYTTGDILYASATNTLSKLPIGSAGTVLTVSAGVPSWGSNGLYTLNGISAASQTFTTTNSGSDFTINSTVSGSSAIHSFNLPDAGISNRGLLNSAIGNQQIGGNKEFKGSITMTSNLTTNANLVSKYFKLNQFSDPSGSQYTVGSIMTATDASGTAGWSTNINVGSITATSVATGSLKVTGGTLAAGSVLTSDASGNASWTSNFSAGSLSGGAAGSIPYQSAPSITSFTAAGTSGQILVSGGTYTPTWTSNITVGTVTATTLSTGNLKVTGGTLAAGSVLTSDAYGNATWGNNGVYSLNGASASTHNFATSSTGTDFTITSSAASGTATHTFNLPDASSSNRGIVTTGTQTFAGSKTFSGTTTVASLAATSITASGNISSTTLTTANFTKAVAGAPAYGTSGSTIDFSQSNLAYTSASAGNFTLNNMKDGGTYTLAVQGTTSGTLNPSGGGFSYVSLGNYATVSGKQTVYTFVVMGTTVYYSMVSAQ